MDVSQPQPRAPSGMDILADVLLGFQERASYLSSAKNLRNGDEAGAIAGEIGRLAEQGVTVLPAELATRVAQIQSRRQTWTRFLAQEAAKSNHVAPRAIALTQVACDAIQLTLTGCRDAPTRLLEAYLLEASKLANQLERDIDALRRELAERA